MHWTWYKGKQIERVDVMKSVTDGYLALKCVYEDSRARSANLRRERCLDTRNAIAIGFPASLSRHTEQSIAVTWNVTTMSLEPKKSLRLADVLRRQQVPPQFCY